MSTVEIPILAFVITSGFAFYGVFDAISRLAERALRRWL